MALSGFEAGYQDAMDQMQSRAVQQQQMELRAQQIQQNQMTMQKLAYEQQVAEQSKQLVGMSFSAGARTRQNEQLYGQNASLIGGLQNAGTSLMSLDPTEGRKFIEEARSLRYQSMTEQRVLRQQRADKQGDIGAYMATINNQETLDATMPELAKLGYVMPEQFRNFNPLSKEFYTTQALRFMGTAKAMEHQLRVRKVEEDAENKKSLEADRLERDKDRDARLELERNKVDIARYKSQSKEVKYPNVADDIETSIPEYGELSPAHQGAMDHWVTRNANALVKQSAGTDEPIDQEEALSQSIETAKGMIAEEGGTKVFGFQVTKPKLSFNPTSAKSQEQEQEQEEKQEEKPQYQNGQIYQNSRGQKAMYQNGKWMKVQ